MAEDKNTLGIAQVPIRATLDKLDGDLKSAKRKLDGGLGGIVGQIGGTLGKIGAGIGKVALGVAAGGIAAIAGLGAAAVAAGMTVDEAYDTIIAKTGATGTKLEELKGSFNTVFGQFPGDAKGTAEALSNLSTRIGLTGKPLEDLTLAMLRMSDLTGTDAATNTESFARVLGDWGIPAEGAATALDKIYKASQLTGVGVDALMTKVVQFGAPLRLMGFTFDEGVALFSKWEKEGVNAELVMGSLRIAAGKFAKAGTPLRESLLATFKSIETNTDASAALAEGMEVFGARAGPDMVAAIREGRFSIEDLTAALGESEGAIAAAALATMDWPEKLELLKNKATTILAPIGLAFMDVASNILDKANPALESFGNFINEKVVPAIAPFMQGLQDLFNTGTPTAWAALGVPQSVLDSIANFSSVMGQLKGIIKLALEGLFSGQNVWEDLPAQLDPSGNFTASTPGLKSRFMALGSQILGWIGEGLKGVLGLLDDMAGDFVDWANGDGGTAAFDLGTKIADKIIGTLHDIIFGEDTSTSVGKDLEDMLVAAVTKINIGVDTIFAKTFAGIFTRAAESIIGSDQFSKDIAASLEKLFMNIFTIMSPLLLGQKIWAWIRSAITGATFESNPSTIGDKGTPAKYDPAKLLNPGGNFAGGVTGIVRQPTSFIAGEIPELLTVTPLSRLGSGSSGGGGISGGTFIFQFPNARSPKESADAVHGVLLRNGAYA